MSNRRQFSRKASFQPLDQRCLMAADIGSVAAATEAEATVELPALISTIDVSEETHSFDATDIAPRFSTGKGVDINADKVVDRFGGGELNPDHEALGSRNVGQDEGGGQMNGESDSAYRERKYQEQQAEKRAVNEANKARIDAIFAAQEQARNMRDQGNKKALDILEKLQEEERVRDSKVEMPLDEGSGNGDDGPGDSAPKGVGDGHGDRDEVINKLRGDYVGDPKLDDSSDAKHGVFEAGDLGSNQGNLVTTPVTDSTPVGDKGDLIPHNMADLVFHNLDGKINPVTSK